MRVLSILILGCASAIACAQDKPAPPMSMSAGTLIDAELAHSGSGTGIEPPSTPVPMMMSTRGGWQLMLHANAFAANTQQQAANERGRDAWFSTNWIMPMAQRKLGQRGEVTLRAMFSFEPGLMRGRRYPELFQQGETAFGAPIVDGQHPHDFFMETAALFDFRAAPNTLVSLYIAPVGDPAIGPVAYPHRLSASEDPIAALGHHQQDSTHIAFNVVTGGVTYKWARLELSGFHGGEPSEAHWHFQPSSNGHAIDSVATRITVAPTADWSAQYSIAHITSPEALYPHEDQQRQTASVMYHHTFHNGAAPATQHSMASMPGMQMGSMPGMDMTAMQHDASSPAMPMSPEPRTDLSMTALWGRTKSLADSSKENSYLLEVLLRFAQSNYAWTRIENAGRSNELLLTPGSPLPANFAEEPIGHVAAFTVGYDHDLPIGRHLLAAPGAQIIAYHVPPTLTATYGAHPTSEVFFVRFRLR